MSSPSKVLANTCRLYFGLCYGHLSGSAGLATLVKTMSENAYCVIMGVSFLIFIAYMCRQ